MGSINSLEKNMTFCMILDDDEIACQISAKILIDMGLDPVQMSDSIAALNRCKQKAPDLLILDIMMPKLDGIEFLKELRKTQAGLNTYVIACTARSEAETVLKMSQAGVNDYIVKPFSPELLERKVNSSGLFS